MMSTLMMVMMGSNTHVYTVAAAMITVMNRIVGEFAYFFRVCTEMSREREVTELEMETARQKITPMKLAKLLAGSYSPRVGVVGGTPPKVGVVGGTPPKVGVVGGASRMTEKEVIPWLGCMAPVVARAAARMSTLPVRGAG